MAADQMAVALATLGGISERRIEQMTNPQTSQLPAFLVRHAGLNSGFMILQVTAAALASELKPLAAPHSVDSIPTSANQEDYVSMGMGGARRLEPMLENLRNILAIELLAACQGIDLLAPLRPGPETRKAYDIVQDAFPGRGRGSFARAGYRSRRAGSGQGIVRRVASVKEKARPTAGSTAEHKHRVHREGTGGTEKALALA